MKQNDSILFTNQNHNTIRHRNCAIDLSLYLITTQLKTLIKS